MKIRRQAGRSRRAHGGVASLPLRRRRALVLAAAVVAATTDLAQAGEVLGVLDPQTGILMPSAAPAVAPDAASAPVARLGTFKFVVQFAIGPEIPASTSVDGYVSIGTSDPQFVNMVTNTGSFSRSGSKGTLTLEVPYYWTVASAGESVNVFFDASTGAAAGYYAYTRFITVQLPQNGAQTTLNIDGAL